MLILDVVYRLTIFAIACFVLVKIMDLTTLVASLKQDVSDVNTAVGRVLTHVQNGDNSAAIAELQTLDTQLKGITSSLNTTVPPEGGDGGDQTGSGDTTPGQTVVEPNGSSAPGQTPL